MNPSQEFNDAYASKGTRALKLLAETRDLITDMPADLSCAANPVTDYEVLINVHADLLKAKSRLLLRKGADA
jgi:hypothetical protein